MTPAEEKLKLNLARKVIENLIPGGKTMTELFGAMSGAERAYNARMITILETGGVLRKVTGANGTAAIIYLNDKMKARLVLDNEELLSRVVWPSPDLLKKGPEVMFASKPVIQSKVPILPPFDATFITARKVLPAETPKAVEMVPKSLPPEAPVEPVQVPVSSAPVAFSPTVDVNTQLLERLLVVMEAACQSIIYTREKVDSLEVEVRALAEAFK